MLKIARWNVDFLIGAKSSDMEKWLGELLYAHHRHVVKLVHVVEYAPIVVAA